MANSILLTVSHLIENNNIKEAKKLLDSTDLKDCNEPVIWYYYAKIQEIYNNIAAADKHYRKAMLLDGSELTFIWNYNQFRIANFQKLPYDRPRVLIGGGASAGQGQNYWAFGFMSFCDVMIYGFLPHNENPLPHFVPYTSLRDFSQTVEQLPPGWEPELVIHFTPEFNFVPYKVSNLPYPTLAMVQDIYTSADSVLQTLDQFDLVGCFDEEAVPLFEKLTKAKVFYAPGNGLNLFSIKPIPGENEKYDIVFLGNIDRSSVDPNYIFRDRIIEQLNKLSGEFSILISSALGDPAEHGPNYVSTLNQTKIGICCTHTQKIHPTLCEIMGSKKLAFINAGNKAVERVFVPGEDIVVYTENDFEDKLKYYLSHPEERLRIAQNGYKKVINNYTFSHQMQKVFTTAKKTIAAFNWAEREFNKITLQEKLLKEGVTAFYTCNFHAALLAFNQASIAEGKALSEVYNNIAILMLLQNHSDTEQCSINEALEYLELAISEDPNNIIAVFNIYQIKLIYFKQDDGELFNKVTDLLKSDESLVANYYKYSIIYSSEFFNIAPGTILLPQSHFRIKWGMLRLLFMANQPDARQNLKNLLISRIFYLRANSLFEADLFSDAIEWYRKSIEAGSEDPQSYFELGKSAYELNLFSESSTALAKAISFRPLFKEAKQLLAKFSTKNQLSF